MSDEDEPVRPGDAATIPPRDPSKDASHRDRNSPPPRPRPAVPGQSGLARTETAQPAANDLNLPPDPGPDGGPPPPRLRSIPMWVRARDPV